LVEGYRHAGLPTIELFRAANPKDANRELGGEGILQHNDWIPDRYEAYTRYIEIEVNRRSCQSMYNQASSLYENPPDYFGVGYNCQNFVDEVLSVGGVDISFWDSKAFTHIIPYSYYSHARYIDGAKSVSVGKFQ
jgi:hypothetical protein